MAPSGARPDEVAEDEITTQAAQLAKKFNILLILTTAPQVRREATLAEAQAYFSADLVYDDGIDLSEKLIKILDPPASPAPGPPIPKPPVPFHLQRATMGFDDLHR